GMAAAGDSSDTGGASSGASGTGTRPSSGGVSSGGRSQGGAPNTAGSGGMGSGGAAKGGAPSSGGKSSGGTSSGGVATGGTGGASTGGATTWPPELIDDMEKVDHFILPNDGRNGQWFPWADAEKGATVTPSPTPVMASLPTGEKGTAPGSQHALHFTLFGGDAGSQGALMGVEMIQSTDAGQKKFPYDATKYKGIHFWARAQGEEATVLVRLPLRDTLLAARGACDDTAGKLCNDHYSREVTLSTDWQEYTLLWSSFQQGDWGLPVKPFDPSQLVEVQFMAPATFSAELWVDDISFAR
ncbi:MAG TPA: hypothetical protein VFQ61_35370, partial [Polyangiaceae bacterium]|nr:hypothetical protein [Polyangiaceae bacterium]